MSKRGLAGLIVPVLVVLISLVGAGIVWVVVVPQINSVGQGVSATACLESDIQIQTCTYDDANVSLLVSRGGKQVNVSHLQLVFDQQGVKKVVTVDHSPGPLESRRFTLSRSDVPIPSKAFVVAVIGDTVCAPSNAPVNCGSGNVPNDIQNIANPACSDGTDNDGDGATDYPDDYSCSNANDNDEQYPLSACQNGEDDDLDGWTDLIDPGCISNQTNTESFVGTSECSNQIDDGDSEDNLVDGNDPGCSDPNDDSEFDSFWRKLNGGNPVNANFDYLYSDTAINSRSISTLQDVNGNLVYSFLDHDPQSMYFGRITTGKSWQMLTFNGWSNNPSDIPKPITDNRFVVSKIKMFNIAGSVMGTIAASPIAVDAQLDIHDRIYAFNLTGSKMEYWANATGYNKNVVTPLSSTVFGAYSYNHDTDINSQTMLAVATASQSVSRLTAAKYNLQTGKWESWKNGNWSQPTNLVYSDVNMQIPAIPFSRFTRDTAPLVTSLPGSQNFLITYAAYVSQTGKTSLYAGLYNATSSNWSLWNNGWKKDYTLNQADIIPPVTGISVLDYRKQVVYNDLVYLVYRKAGTQNVDAPVYLVTYNITSMSWSSESQLLGSANNFEVGNDGAGNLWITYSTGDVVKISQIANGAIVSSEDVYQLKLNARLMGMGFIQANAVIFIGEKQGKAYKVYALGKKGSNNYWDNEQPMLTDSLIDLVPLESIYGSEINQTTTGIWINISYNGNLYKFESTYGNQHCGYLSIDSEGHVYCPKTQVNSLGIFPLNYTEPLGADDETARSWGGWWDYLYFPSSAAVDNTRGRVYITDHLAEGDEDNDQISGQLQVWNKSWNKEHVLIDLPPPNDTVHIIPQRWSPYVYSKAEPTHQLNMPSDSAIDEARGLLYLSETNANRIVVYDIASAPDNPQFLRVIGSEGSGPGQFNRPMGIDTDASGNLYVSDGGNNRIQKFNSNGNFVISWGQTGRSIGNFIYPVALAVDKLKGYIYVADTGNKRISIFRQDGTHVYSFDEWNPRSPTIYSTRNFEKVGGLAANNNLLYVSAGGSSEGDTLAHIISFQMNFS